MSSLHETDIDISDVAEVVAFLRREIDRKHLPVELYGDGAVIRDRHLKIGAYVAGEHLDAYDKAWILQNLEDTWNDQEGRPDFWLTLVPSAQRRRAVNGTAH